MARPLPSSDNESNGSSSDKKWTLFFLTMAMIGNEIILYFFGSGLIIDKDLGNMVKVDRFGCA